MNDLIRSNELLQIKYASKVDDGINFVHAACHQHFVQMSFEIEIWLMDLSIRSNTAA